MAVTVNLKPQVDMPVWEWSRFTPANAAALSGCTRAEGLGGRHIYYLNTNILYRYDTITDTWQTLATGTASRVTSSIEYDADEGYHGRVISCPTTSTLIIAAYNGNSFVGSKIRIVSGTGAGQEKTISAVSERIVYDYGYATGGAVTSITDTNVTGPLYRQWKINQWRDYQVRVFVGTGLSQVRKILYNSGTVLTVSDVNYSTLDAWAICPFVTAPAAGSLYQIEASTVTVSSPFTVQPDNTSRFVIMGGGIWHFTSVSGTPFFYLQMYDILTDLWYNKSAGTNVIGLEGTDLSLEEITEETAVISGAAASTTTLRRVIQAGATFTPMQYAGFQLRVITSPGTPTAVGQFRKIIANDATSFTLGRDFDVKPDDTCTYSVFPDNEKLWAMFGGQATIAQYNKICDQWSTGVQYDWGIPRRMSCKPASAISGIEAQGITSITSVGNTNGIKTVAVNAPGTNYWVGDILALTTTGSGGKVRVTSVSSVGAVTGIAIETTGSGYTGSPFSSATSPTGSAGSGCTITISVVTNYAYVTTAVAHNYIIGDVVVIAGCTGATTGYNGTFTIVGVDTTTTFTYDIAAATPGAATYVDQSTTVLVDVTKNWGATGNGELAGKLLQSITVGPASTVQVRRILSNTATTITIAGTALWSPAPANGTTRYMIVDMRPFGSDTTVARYPQTTDTNSVSPIGIATAGGATSLTCSWKNWPTNWWANPVQTAGKQRKVKIIAGTGSGYEMAITSNTATVLSYAAPGFTPDTTTVFEIMDTYGLCTTGGTTTFVDSTQHWPVGYFVGKRVKILAGTVGVGAESTVTANTVDTPTITSLGMLTTDSVYSILGVPVRGTGFSLENADGATTNKHVYMYSFRGGATPVLDRYNINDGIWDTIMYTPQTDTFTSGTYYAYDLADRIYIIKEVVAGRVYYYDIANNKMVLAGTVPYGMGAATIGNRMEVVTTIDGLKYLYVLRHATTDMWRMLLWF